LIEKSGKRRKLTHEMLGLVCLCFALSLLLFVFITIFGTALIEDYCFQNDIVMDEFDWYDVDNTMRIAGFAVSTVFFTVMFFALFGERLAYVRKITAGVDMLREGNYGGQVELRGNNELTELAEAVNYLSESERKLKEKEKHLYEEREELIRMLSHDIRTPLTSIMSYTELLSEKETLTDEEQKEYLSLVSKKTAQIKELTDILLDGGRRELELFEDARLLFIQLADEFESELEDAFQTMIELSSLIAFSGRFDVGEMRRIFDNLISNIRKYAEPTEAVWLVLSKTENGVLIRQSNIIKKDNQPWESYKMGLHSIRRIAQNYGGTVEVHDTDGKFEIMITLSNI
jgi:signal transduction histidine kinase